MASATHLLYEELEGAVTSCARSERRARLTAGKGQPVEDQAGSNQGQLSPLSKVMKYTGKW